MERFAQIQLKKAGVSANIANLEGKLKVRPQALFLDFSDSTSVHIAWEISKLKKPQALAKVAAIPAPAMILLRILVRFTLKILSLPPEFTPCCLTNNRFVIGR